MIKHFLILVRGISGSGKSTLAEQLASVMRVARYEADMYFCKEGSYKFDPSLLGKAHEWCLTEADYNLSWQSTIVSNTFTTAKELRPYINSAKQRNALVMLLEPPTSWKNDVVQCASKNIHNVPLDRIQQQFNRWLNIPQGIYDPQDLLNANSAN